MKDKPARESRPALRRRLLQPIAVAALSAIGGTGVMAMELDTGNPDLKVRLDNTIRYSGAYRLGDRSSGLAATVPGAVPGTFVGTNNINQDDGDNNFNRGVVSSRIDVLSELDLSYRNLGARLSGAAWYDQVYNRNTDNTSTSANHLPGREFAPETRKVMGRKAELLDAFVFGKFELGETPATFRLGRHTLLWGESLFFGANGIAGGMAPIDIIKAQSVPNSQFKEIGRPTGKLSGQVQLSSDVALGAYIGYEWEKSRLPASGSYLSTIDPGGPGGETLRAGPNTVRRASDLDARSGGQGGVQLRWRLDSVDTDLGFYAIRFHALTPSNLNFSAPPTVAGSNYRFLYQEGIKAYGVSAAKTIGDWSLATEASYRQNAPLASSSQVSPGFAFNNSNNPGYAVGETAHWQASWLASLGPSFIANEASFVGEIAWNKRVKVTRNAQMLNPEADKSATGMRMVYSPTYRQVLPGLDLTPSIGLGYTWGKSSALGAGFGVDKGGDLNIGLAGVYLGRWNVNLNYVHFLGPEGGANNNAGNAQFKQALKDRNFISLSLRTTF
ncbi:MAG: DUF1302 domain-containing protein [Pseudomonadota bacterium]